MLLVLGILMAIAIPLIGGVREAANNTKCRSNLKQLHTAIFAYATGNKERLPNLAGNDNLQSLIDGGYIDADTKLGDCPGSPAKERGSDSAYQSGSKLDGVKRLSALKSDDIILADETDTYHKSGRNVILLDGRFRQGKGVRITLSTDDIEDINQEILTVYEDNLLTQDQQAMQLRELIEKGADIDMIVVNGKPLLIDAVYGGLVLVVQAICQVGEGRVNFDIQDSSGNTALHEAVYLRSTAVLADLLSAHADWTVEDNQGRNVLEYAIHLRDDTGFLGFRYGNIVDALEAHINQ